MSRIRSVHPGFFTDEELVSVGMASRLLFIGLGIEGDDKGIFEWKPLTLKMRIFPADHVMLEELLAELVNAGKVMKFEVAGKTYGAIRNFCKFQRPKKPNNIHPITEQAAAWTGYDGEVVPNQLPTGGEKSPQMEEGGGNSSSVSNDTDAEAVVDPTKVMFDAGVSLIVSCGKSQTSARSWLAGARKTYGTEAVISAIGRAKREGSIDPISFMEGCLRARARDAPLAVVGL